MSKLKISNGLSVPIDAVTQTFGIFGIRGSGKTHTAVVMVEEMLKAGQPVCIYDPVGAWFGLKSSADGKRAGFPVVVFGGEHADVPLAKEAGETVARVIVGRRIPAILDVSLMRKGERVQFMTAFCETLYHRNREPLHFVVDEAHTVAPQRPIPEIARLLGAVEDIVLQGRRRGLGLTIVSQRPALVNTNIRTQCATLIAMRIIGPHDLKAVQEWTDAHGTAEQAAELMDSLPTLKTGEGWVWSPAWLDIFKRVAFRQRETFDSSATPEVGKRAVTPKVLAEIDLAALGQEIQSTVERAKANDPAALKRHVAELEKQLAARPTAETVRAVEKRVEVPVLKNGQLERTERTLARLEALAEKIPQLVAPVVAEAAELRRLIAPASGQGGGGRSLKPLHGGAPAGVETGRVARPLPAPTARVASAAKPARVPGTDGPSALGKCESAILSVLAQFPEGCAAGKLTLLSGYRWTGSFRNSLAALRTAGLIEGDNGGTMKITVAGLSQGPFPELPSGRALVDYWMSNPHFGACERKILRAVIDNPAGLTGPELCEATGYGWTGSFRNSLGALRTAGVLVGKNTETMRASEELLEAANSLPDDHHGKAAHHA